MGLFKSKKKDKAAENTNTPPIKEESVSTVGEAKTNGRRRLIVACGSGVATSQTIASKVKSMLLNDGIDYPVEAVDYKSISTELRDASIYLYIAKPDDAVLEQAERLGIHVFAGIPFLTGMGVEKIYEEIKGLIQ